MRTYDERISNIQAKAAATQKAYRAIAAAISTVTVLGVLVCAFVIFPFFQGVKEPNSCGSLEQPYATQADDDCPQETPDTHPAATFATSPTTDIDGDCGPMDGAPADTDQGNCRYMFDQACIKVTGCDTDTMSPVLIRSVEQLQAYLDKHDMELTGFDAVRNYAAKYGDSYFQSGSLILFVCTEGSGSNLVSLSDVQITEDGGVYISVDRIVPGPDMMETCDMAYWYVFAEADATQLNAENIAIEYSESYYMEELAHSVKLLPLPYQEWMRRPSVTVVRSVEELQAFCSADAFQSNIYEYDREFFEQNTLVLVSRFESSSGNANAIADVWQMSNGDIRIHVDRWPYGVLANISTWCAAITIPQVLDDGVCAKADYRIVQERPETAKLVGFSAQAVAGAGCFSDIGEDGKVAVIRTMQELANHFGEDSNIYREYSETFFDENTLVVYYRNEASGMARHTVSQVYREVDGSYTAYIYSIYPEIFTEDIGCGVTYMQIQEKIPSDVQFRVVNGMQIITNECWQERYAEEQIIVPTKPADTNLEFWLGQDVSAVDLSTYAEVYGWFGVREFLGIGYNSIENPYVSYIVGAYPDESDGGNFVRSITITDPNVLVYGLSIYSTNEEFKDVFYSMGYELDESAGTYYARKDRISVVFTQGQQLVLTVQITNRDGIVY